MIEKLIHISRTKSLKSYQNIKEWSVDYYKNTQDQSPIDRAILGGFMCQQFSFAFMAGYQAALDIMFPMVGRQKIKALCVSEAKGVHPKAIQTTLQNNEINGIKTYVTAGSEVEHLLVLCKTDEEVNGKPLLKMVEIPVDNQIEINNFDLPFMKEIKHGKLILKDFKIDAPQILEGDGYSEYTKSFRSLEDICVSAAYQAMLLRQVIDNQWEEGLRDQLLLSIYTLKNLINLSYNAPETILLIAANERHFRQSIDQIEANISKHSPDDFKLDWKMNKPVLSLAKKLKEYRLSKNRALLFNID